MKNILLKNLIREIIDTDGSPLKYQCYVDMDGVLVDMDGGFKKISGGLLPKEYEEKHGKNSFWKVVNEYPDFWINLDPLPGAKNLWNYIDNTFKEIQPVILTAGKGTRIREQKTEWVKTNIGPGIKVILAESGVLKPNYSINNQDKSIIHVLLDDMERNIVAWNNFDKNYKAILHISNDESKFQINNLLKNEKN